MKKLSNKEMTNIQGGISSCAKVLLGLGGAMAGAAMGNPFAAALGMATLYNWVGSCESEGGFASMF